MDKLIARLYCLQVIVVEVTEEEVEAVIRTIRVKVSIFSELQSVCFVKELLNLIHAIHFKRRFLNCHNINQGCHGNLYPCISFSTIQKSTN